MLMTPPEPPYPQETASPPLANTKELLAMAKELVMGNDSPIPAVLVCRITAVGDD